jgi:hypothetical protein
VIHSHLAAPAALASANEDGPSRSVEVTLGEIKRLADPETGAPQDDDQRA